MAIPDEIHAHIVGVSEGGRKKLKLQLLLESMLEQFRG